MTSRARIALGATALLLPLVLAAQGQAPVRDGAVPIVRGTASVSGRLVTDTKPPQPMRRARVTLNAVSRTIPGRTTTSDDDGRFAFTELPAGRFTIQAYKPAFLTASYGAARPDRSGTPLAVAEGQQIANVVIPMARGGVVTGTVRDRRGAPVQGIAVSVMRLSYSALTGERTLGFPSGSAIGGSTDSHGVYRAFGLPPGEYIVFASPGPIAGRSSGAGTEDIRPLTSAEVQRAIATANGPGLPSPTPALPGSPSPLAPQGSRVNYTPVFYPGVTDIAAASTITLGLAEERGGIDLPIVLVPTARVSGVVTVPNGIAANAVSVALTPTSENPELLAGAGMRALTGRLTAESRYTIAGVPPGRYVLSAATGGGSRGPVGRGGPSSDTSPVHWARAEITIEGNDVDVPLALEPGLVVTGRVVFEGARLPPAGIAALGLRVVLIPPGSGGNIGAGPAGGQVGDDGQFTYAAAVPDRYRWLTVSPAGLGSWSVKTATASGRDVFDSTIDLQPGRTTDIVLTFTDRPTRLTGSLQDATGRPATDYFVIVFPADRGKWKPGSRLVLSTRPATDGAFSTAGLPPGDYFLAVMTDVEDGDWNDVAFLEKLVPTSVKVTLRDGETTTQPFRIGGHE